MWHHARIICHAALRMAKDFSFTIVKDGMPTVSGFVQYLTDMSLLLWLLAVLNCDEKVKNIPDESICARVRALKVRSS